MWSNKKSKVLCVALGFSLVAGCATTEENQQVFGAAGGAMLGCLAGTLISRNAKGCAAGALAGAAVGWSAVKVSQYNATQVRSATEDQRVYGLTKPPKSTLVKINKGVAAPENVKPGAQVSVVTDYSLLVPSGMAGADVTESWVLKKDGKVLANLPPQRVYRQAGGWAADATIPIPSNAKPGTYVVETKVQAGTSYDVNQAVFVVES